MLPSYEIEILICKVFWEKFDVYIIMLSRIYINVSPPLSLSLGVSSFGSPEDRVLTPADVQSFSNGVGRQWKHVGRALGKSCRALKGPAIDNLAYEYEREGLYEQAYQLLSRFIQAEGRAAKLSRLVRALEDSKLTSLAENMLGMQP